MSKTVSKFTVFFEDPFWVGIYERWENGKYEVAKITFGSEPKDYEIYDFLLKNYTKIRFSRPTHSAEKSQHKINPKRMQRLIKKELQIASATGTKAQQALKQEYEQNKTERKKSARERRREVEEIKLIKHRIKRLEKHKGH